jgi:hypothetical protein
LKFTFESSRSFLTDFVDPAKLPDELTTVVQKIYSSCVKKFSKYMHARRVLLADPHAELRHNDAEWWRRVFSVLSPPDEVPEIWSGTFDWVDEESEDWVFERLY